MKRRFTDSECEVIFAGVLMIGTITAIGTATVTNAIGNISTDDMPETTIVAEANVVNGVITVETITETPDEVEIISEVVEFELEETTEETTEEETLEETTEEIEEEETTMEVFVEDDSVEITQSFIIDDEDVLPFDCSDGEEVLDVHPPCPIIDDDDEWFFDNDMAEETTEVIIDETVESIDVVDEDKHLEQPEEYYDEDYILLCNCVANEAGGCNIPVSDKALVVEVIMNRVNSNIFPNSIREVILQKGQFEGSGKYGYLKSFSNKVNDDVKQAIDEYFSNQEKYNHGYLYFYGDGLRNHFR